MTADSIHHIHVPGAANTRERLPGTAIIYYGAAVIMAIGAILFAFVFDDLIVASLCIGFSVGGVLFGVSASTGYLTHRIGHLTVQATTDGI
ncbi:MAG: hypothetical protein ACK5Q5_24985, partial [Planctomycetaceae bacterium]